MNARGNDEEDPEDIVGVRERCGNSMKPSTKVEKQTKPSKYGRVTKKLKVKQ